MLTRVILWVKGLWLLAFYMFTRYSSQTICPTIYHTKLVEKLLNDISIGSWLLCLFFLLMTKNPFSELRDRKSHDPCEAQLYCAGGPKEQKLASYPIFEWLFHELGAYFRFTGLVCRLFLSPLNPNYQCSSAYLLLIVWYLRIQLVRQSTLDP